MLQPIQFEQLLKAPIGTEITIADQHYVKDKVSRSRPWAHLETGKRYGVQTIWERIGASQKEG